MSGTIQEVIGILDRSGSMYGKEKDTVGGINSLLSELKSNYDANSNDIIRVSLKLFDHEEQLLWRSRLLSDIDCLNINEFCPRGQTALLDALGNTLKYFMQKRLLNPEAYTKCLIYLATDGYENCSKIYTRQDIKKMIETAKTQYNIDVIYLAANQDAILEAGNIGIDANQAINYAENRENTEAVYRAVGRIASTQRSNTSENIGFTLPERQASQPADTNRDNYAFTSPERRELQNNYRLHEEPPPIRRQTRHRPVTNVDINAEL